MNELSRANLTLAYLVAVLLLGGASAAGQGSNLLLQVLGAGLIGWTLFSRDRSATLHTGLRKFAIAVAVLAAVQFLPLPAALWPSLPGRDAVAGGFRLLGVPVPWFTLSLAPWYSLASLTWWIPALALFLALREAGAPPTRHIVLVIAGVAGLSVALGAVQRVAGSGYLYLITNYGTGPGFFANSNHQGSFLLCALAVWGGYMADKQQSSRVRRSASWSSGPQLVLAAVGLLLLMGVLVSGSLACVALLFPVMGAFALTLRPDWRIPLPVVLLAMVATVAGLALFLLYGPVANDLTAKGTVAGISRQEFLITGSRILKDFAPFGSGLGTFPDLYRWYENPALVGTTFVNHAHDDLLELLIETGVFGLAALGLFFGWFVPRAWAVWSGDRKAPYQLAASVVITAELLHSLVDYPLRTAAMSSVMAIACVLLVRPAEIRRSGRPLGQPTASGTDSGMIKI